MSEKKHLFIGFGDLASRCAQQLIAQGDHVVGVSRRERPDQPGLSMRQGDAKDPLIAKWLTKESFESVVITLTPDESSEAGYRRSYFEPCKNLMDIWQNSECAPKKILFISSTSVYAQRDGEWVDEDSPAIPVSPTAKVLRETENLFLTSKLNTSIIRFSGIYGPGRYFLIRQVLAGKGGNQNFTNRIHVDDCVGVILFLLQQETLQNIYLASDDTPVESAEIRTWLAEQLGYTGSLQLSESPGRAGSKRCSNKRLKAQGYVFTYANYKKGYEGVVSGFLGEADT